MSHKDFDFEMSGSENLPEEDQSGALGIGEIVTDLVKVKSIEILDEWSGYNPLAPFKASYSIIPELFSSTVKALHTIGSENRNTLMEGFELMLSRKVLQGFLKKVAEVPIIEGKYQPTWDHTDDYPSIEIKLKVGNRQLKLFTSSQGENHLPWGATYNKREYVISSPVLAQAYQELLTQVHHDRLTTLINMADKSDWQPLSNSIPLPDFDEDFLKDE